MPCQGCANLSIWNRLFRGEISCGFHRIRIDPCSTQVLRLHPCDWLSNLSTALCGWGFPWVSPAIPLLTGAKMQGRRHSSRSFNEIAQNRGFLSNLGCHSINDSKNQPLSWLQICQHLARCYFDSDWLGILSPGLHPTSYELFKDLCWSIEVALCWDTQKCMDLWQKMGWSFGLPQRKHGSIYCNHPEGKGFPWSGSCRSHFRFGETCMHWMDLFIFGEGSRGWVLPFLHT